MFGKIAKFMGIEVVKDGDSLSVNFRGISGLLIIIGFMLLGSWLL